MNIEDSNYSRIGRELIASVPDFQDIRDCDVRIAFLSSDVEKKKDGRLVFGDCTKVNKGRYDWCCPYDFFITIYEPNVISFDEEQIEALLTHELSHIGVNNEGTEPSFYIVPHDIEDFWLVLNKYGMDWQKERT